MYNNNIPTINVKKLLNGNINSLETKKIIKDIEHACLEWGFFTIIGHGISENLINSILKSSYNFFNLPEKEKLKIAAKKWNKKNSNVYRGYFPSSVNGKEGLDIGDYKLKKEMIRKLPKDKFEYLNLKKVLNNNSLNIIEKYFDSMFALGEILFKAITKNFNANPSIVNKVFIRPKTLTTLRFNFYPKQNKPVEISNQDGELLGCETHVDSGIMTILYQDKEGGLQVQNRHSLKWHKVPYNKKSFIVNTGLALEYLTNGKYKATNHRVIFNNKKRVSIPFFYEPSYDFSLNPSLLGIKSKPRFKINNYLTFLKGSLNKFAEYNR